MHLKLIKVEYEDMSDEILRERANVGGKTKYTEHYIVKQHDREIGFLSIDPYPPPRPFFIYEIFVLKDHRQQGCGSYLLEKAEEFAKKRGSYKIILKPEPLDLGIDKGRLKAWYRKQGYCPSSEYEGQLEKRISEDVGT